MAQICLECIGDEALRKLVAERAEELKCTYCSGDGAGLSIDQLAELVDEYLRQYLCFGKYEPRLSDDSERTEWEQHGDPLAWLLQEELEIEEQVAEDLFEALKARDNPDPRSGEGPFYSDDQLYCRRYISSDEYYRSWDGFSFRVRHRRRFFDDLARTWLSELLGSQGSNQDRDLPVITIGPDQAISHVFRARLADTAERLVAIRESPGQELGPPPADRAIAGRMNAAGIPFFYGALSEDTAIAEARPFVGSRVIVARFHVIRPVRLLNLPMLGSLSAGRIFRPDYEERVAHIQFLQSFHTMITHPVLPSDELLEYIPTQVVAEFIKNVLGFDGILYMSAQTGSSPEEPESTPPPRWNPLSESELARCNVVLFGGREIISGAGAAVSAPAPQGSNSSLAGVLALDQQNVGAYRIQRIQYEHTIDYDADYELSGDGDSEHEDF